jgi:hypothetical protein
VPAVDAHLGQDSTDTPACYHLTTRLAFTPTIDSTRRQGPRPTVRSATPMPTRCDQAAQSAQSERHVPVCTCISLPCPTPKQGRHASSTSPPPLPSALEHARGLAKPETIRIMTESTHVATKPSSHRRHRTNPWTQPTTPPQSTAHDVQWFPKRCTLDRVYSDSIKPKTPSRALHCCSFGPISFPSCCRATPP